MENLSNFVDESLLEFENDALTLNGVPYTGISTLDYPSGKRKSELSYKDGFPDGICREWYENGNIQREWIALRGAAPAEVTEWFDNGAIKSKKISEHGVEIEYVQWDLSGEAVVTRKLNIGSPMYSFLEKMRTLKRN